MYHVHFDGKNHGPYLLDQINSMWASGVITADAMYWTEGATDWKPVTDLIAPNIPKQSAMPPPPPAENIPLRHEPEASISTPSEKEEPWNSTTPRPWRRLWARTLDGLLLSLILSPITMAIWNHTTSYLIPCALGAGVGLIAFALAEASLLTSTGTTLGKYFFGLRVKTRGGEQLSFGQAIMRFLSIYWRQLLIIPPFLAYSDLKKRGSTKWDKMETSSSRPLPLGDGDGPHSF